MASHSRNLMQGERRGRQEQEVVLASNDNSVSTEGHGLDNSNDENRQSRPSPPDSAVTAFGFSNSGLQVGNTYGSVQISSGATVYLGNVSGDHFKSFFGSLSSEHEGPNETERSLLERKQHFQSGRKPLQMLGLPDRYSPYAQVRNRRIKSKLLQIAQHFRFLDRGFAEYFQVVVPSFDPVHTQQLLVEARKMAAKGQREGSHQGVEFGTAYVGDLGHFCEEVSRTLAEPSPLAPKFTFTHGSDEDILHYLQDAFEVPYWKFMLGLFSRWRDNSKSLSGQVLLHVLDSVKLELLNKKHRLEEDLQSLEASDVENISPILEGINLRIQVLEGIWDDTTSYLDDKYEYLSSIFTKLSDSQRSTTNKMTGQEGDEINNQQTETAILVAFVIIFFIAAIIPGYKAFSISMQTSSPGSTKDADFWYLIQSSIMSVMGNIVMVIPLLRKHWLAPAYKLMWVFFALGLFFALISILIYPFLNPGWSSMIAFFSSVASAATVLVMTQATARQVIPTTKFKKS